MTWVCSPRFDDYRPVRTFTDLLAQPTLRIHELAAAQRRKIDRLPDVASPAGSHGIGTGCCSPLGDPIVSSNAGLQWSPWAGFGHW